MISGIVSPTRSLFTSYLTKSHHHLLLNKSLRNFNNFRDFKRISNQIQSTSSALKTPERFCSFSGSIQSFNQGRYFSETSGEAKIINHIDQNNSKNNNNIKKDQSSTLSASIPPSSSNQSMKEIMAK